jgi:phosphoglycolate phosphatase
MVKISRLAGTSHSGPYYPNQTLLKLMKRTALVFDLDGTLVDSLPDLQAALNQTLREIGKPPLTPDAVRRMIGDGTAMLIARGLAASGAPPDRDGRQLRRFLALYEAAPVARTRPYPDVPAVLAALAAAGHALAICTNKPQSATLAVLRGLGLERHFAAIVGGDLLPVRKPDPGHLLGALERLGMSAADAVMIGDNENDVAAAKGAGVPVIVMRYGYARIDVAELGADLVLDRFADLPAGLAALRGSADDRRGSP